MSGSLNRSMLIGHLGKDPTIRATQDGREIASFSLATSESWKDKSGEKQERTQWHNIVCFNEGLVKIIKSYVKKGSKIYVEGQLQTRKWQDKEGKDVYITEVILQGFNGSILLLSGGESQGASKDNVKTESFKESAKKSEGFVDDSLDDEIPF